MRAVFLDHSGFLVESDSAALLFDWWKGELPAVKPGVPLYVFASHVHPDHFDPRIFALDGTDRDVQFVLGHDIKLSPRNLGRWGVSPKTSEKCRNLRGGQSLALPGADVEALSSTDEGEAFLVTVDSWTVFHAGDLNWWHWEEESRVYNEMMRRRFLHEMEKLEGESVDVAFLPLDPRQEEQYAWGFDYFMRHTHTGGAFPMHLWGKYETCDRLLEDPVSEPYRERVRRITKFHQRFEI